MSESLDVRDQPRYGSQVGGNNWSNSESKISRINDASDFSSLGSNFVWSSAHPMGRDATKKGKKKNIGVSA